MRVAKRDEARLRCREWTWTRASHKLISPVDHADRWSRASNAPFNPQTRMHVGSDGVSKEIVQDFIQ